MTGLRSLLLLSAVVCARACYWNEVCPFTLYSTKTPYDRVRGDIRDNAVTPYTCEAVSLWSLNRHGNRNPGNSVTEAVKYISTLKDEILASYNAGNSLLCAQDIDLFKQWTWNTTLDESQSFLTGTGYTELYGIGSRLREKFPSLLLGTPNDYYFRPTNEQRTVVSGLAFIQGLTEGTGLLLSLDQARLRDDVVRPYENCDRYQQEVKISEVLDHMMEGYFNTSEFGVVQRAVQQRLGISTVLSADDIYSIYELCRFDRSWNKELRSPWCAVFTKNDLVVLEYRDDLRHYYRNGYGSWVNERLGELPMQDLFSHMESYVNGTGKKIAAYFTHDTMLEMVFCALGLYRDEPALHYNEMKDERMWKTSYIGNFAVNILFVLNSCNKGENVDYTVQIYVNEKETSLCPSEGCTWLEFKEKFERFRDSNLEFCSMEYRHPEALEPENTNNAHIENGLYGMILALAFLVLRS